MPVRPRVIQLVLLWTRQPPALVHKVTRVMRLEMAVRKGSKLESDKLTKQLGHSVG